jgi:hypothetical protein
MQQKFLTFITAHEFTQHCSILSLNSDAMCAPSAAETSYLYHSTWVHSALFNLVFEQWHDGMPLVQVSLFKDKIEQGWVNSCAVIKVWSFCCTRGTHRVTVQRQDWTRHSTWVHSALFNLVFEQWHDGMPLVQQKLLTFITAHEFTQPFSIHRVTVQRQDWTRLSELMCSDKGKKFLLQ